MKKLCIFILITGFFTSESFGQKLKESDIPSAVVKSFQTKFPGIKGNWEKEDGQYEVNFKKENNAMSMTIEKDGTIVETETSIAVSELPTTVLTYLKNHYQKTKIEEAAKVVKGNGEVNYEAELKGKDVVFDANGMFVKEVKD